MVYTSLVKMPGKMVKCCFCSNVMRSDNLKNHIKNVHRNGLIVPTDESSTKFSSTIPLSKMQAINSILGTGMSSNSIPEKSPTCRSCFDEINKKSWYQEKGIHSKERKAAFYLRQSK